MAYPTKADFFTELDKRVYDFTYYFLTAYYF